MIGLVTGTVKRFFSRPAFPAPPQIPEPWMTIQLGARHWTAPGFRQILDEYGCGIERFASEIFDGIRFTTAKRKAKLVIMPVGELGFGWFQIEKRATPDAVFKRAADLGLSLCPAEVALLVCFLLAIECKEDQPKRNDQLIVAMEPIIGPNGPVMLRIFRDDEGKPWVTAINAAPDRVFCSDEPMLFVRP